MYPEDSIQFIVEPWWNANTTRDFKRGRLIFAYLPHVEQTPKELVVKGRLDPTDHSNADIEIIPFRIHEIHRQASLPVAAMPIFSGERSGVYRVKKRPAIIICSGGVEIPRNLRQGSPKYQTSPTMLVIPAYGVDKDGSRAGYNEGLIKRIRRCEYPQYLLDCLPISGPNESILRFDHIQPLGRHHDSVEFTQHCLSDEALSVFDEWLNWLVKGKPDKDSTLSWVREELINLP